MRLVVGLGNPGPEYRGTRHNIGFLVVDELARRAGVEAWREQMGALVARARIADENVTLAKPLTFMNLSGQAVGALAGYYQVAPADVVVVADDVALPLGRLRLRREGGAGGHNGLKSLIEHLGTRAFPRLRVGVGRGDERRDLSDYVLGRFEAGERDIVGAAVPRAADAVEAILRDGIERAMSAFNAAETQDPDPAD